jgi:hypothetical protein
MSDEHKVVEDEVTPDGADAPDLTTRREFLRSLGKWSAIIIGGAALGGIVAPTDAAAWVNGGAAWVNGRGVGGASWVNRAVGGGAWVNRAVGGGAWVNGVGGGGAWVNNRGGGGAWVNRR